MNRLMIGLVLAAVWGLGWAAGSLATYKEVKEWPGTPGPVVTLPVHEVGAVDHIATVSALAAWLTIIYSSWWSRKMRKATEEADRQVANAVRLSHELEAEVARLRKEGL